MYKFVVVALVGFLMVQGGLAKAVAKKAQEPSQFQELAAKADQIVKNVTATIEGNIPDSKQIIDSYNENAQKLVTGIQSITDKIKAQLESNKGDMDKILKQVSDNLHTAKANIEKALGPDGQKKAKDIKDSVDNGLKDAVNQMEKLGKAVEPEAEKVKNDLVQAAKLFLDNIVEVSNDLQAKLKEQKQ